MPAPLPLCLHRREETGGKGRHETVNKNGECLLHRHRAFIVKYKRKRE